MNNPSSLELLAMKVVDKHNLDVKFSKQNAVSPKLFADMRTKYKKCCLSDNQEKIVEEAYQNGHLQCMKRVRLYKVSRLTRSESYNGGDLDDLDDLDYYDDPYDNVSDQDRYVYEW